MPLILQCRKSQLRFSPEAFSPISEKWKAARSPLEVGFDHNKILVGGGESHWKNLVCLDIIGLCFNSCVICGQPCILFILFLDALHPVLLLDCFGECFRHKEKIQKFWDDRHNPSKDKESLFVSQIFC